MYTSLGRRRQVFHSTKIHFKFSSVGFVRGRKFGRQSFSQAYQSTQHSLFHSLACCLGAWGCEQIITHTRRRKQNWNYAKSALSLLLCRVINFRLFKSVQNDIYFVTEENDAKVFQGMYIVTPPCHTHISHPRILQKKCCSVIKWTVIGELVVLSSSLGFYFPVSH